MLKGKIKKLLAKYKLKKGAFPEYISPQLATPVNSPPEGDNWLHEIKYDGYRLICVIDKEIKLLTRHHLDWTKKFSYLLPFIKKLGCTKTIFDGEVVALDKDNRPSFQTLQNALDEESDQALFYYIFDLPFCEGYDLCNLPLIERKKILQNLLPSTKSGIIYSDHVLGSGDRIFKKACEQSFEGIISKAIDSAYVQKRTKSWLKIKCQQSQEFIVVGFTKPSGSRQYFGSLILGYYEDNILRYAGLVGTGFTQNSLRAIRELLEKLRTSRCPFQDPPPIKHVLGWVKPKLVVEVAFREWTTEKILRQPSFKGIREDKEAHEISLVKTSPKTEYVRNEAREGSKIAGINISNPDRILYPKIAVTKIAVASYYQSIGKWILPYVINRPLTLVRCPKGIEEDCFFQKHLNAKEKGTQHLFLKETAIFVKDLQGIISLVQMGVLEIHIRNCSIDRMDRPDMIVFDLDPAPDVSWEKVIEGAFVLKEELKKYKITSFVKATGGKGLHIVFPIVRRYDWEETLQFSRIFVEYLVNKYPKRFVGTMAKSKRGGKIFVDYFRNHQGATAIAPYSTRAREGAPLAVPLSWDEIVSEVKSNQFTVTNIGSRLAKLKDPWKGYFSLKQFLPKP